MRGERFWQFIAWRLPRPLVMWSAVRLMAAATQGKYSDQVVPELTAIQALQRWSGQPGESGEPLSSQIDRLANCIMANVPGEPSQSEGAVDCAIRLLKQYQTQTTQTVIS